jgi:hypothetical protein
MNLKELILHFINDYDLRQSLYDAQNSFGVADGLPKDHIEFFDKEGLLITKYEASEAGTKKWKSLNHLGWWLADMLLEAEA